MRGPGGRGRLIACAVGIVGLAHVAPAQQADGCMGTCAAQPDSANQSPRYPMLLRSSGVGGSVAVRVVVDTTGRGMHGEWHILRSSHELFAQAVRVALPNWRYRPARQGGRLVLDTLEYEVVFSMPDERGFTVLEPETLSRIRTGPRQWRVEIGWPDRDPAAVLDSATITTVSEAVLGHLLDKVAARSDSSRQPRVACIRWSTGTRIVDVSAATLARLARPGVLVLAHRRCPPTFASMMYIADATERSAAPPGEDPHLLAINRLRPWRDGVVLAEGTVAHGTGAAHYTCAAQRAVTKSGGWKVACGLARYSVSASPSVPRRIASYAR